MRTVIVGCGRVGAALAVQLAAEGQDVHVIDRDVAARRMLPDTFTGRFHEGNGFGRAVLEAAGVAHADALVAATSNDSTNLVTARTAKETYRVPVVVARLHDPDRADAYREFGIPTVAGVRWSVHQFRRVLLHRHLEPELTFGDGETLLVRTRLPAHLTGRPLTLLELDGEIRVVEVTRSGHSLIPNRHTTAESGDLVTLAVAAGSLARLRGFLDKELGT